MNLNTELVHVVTHNAKNSLNQIKREVSIFLSIHLHRNRLNTRNANLCLTEYGGNFLSNDKLCKKKESNTLFVLGAGNSINALTGAEISSVSSADSIGITHTCHHKVIIPTFYYLEPSVLDNIPPEIFLLRKDENDFIFNSLLTKIDLYKNTTFIVKPRNYVQENFKLFLSLIPKENLFWNNSFQLPGGTKSAFRFWLKFYDRILGLQVTNRFFFKAASLIGCLVFAYKLKYQRVVLLGVDLTGPYFFEGKNLDARTDIHNTADPRRVHDGVTVQEILSVVNEELFRPSGIEFLVQRQSTLLASQFKNWNVTEEKL